MYASTAPGTSDRGISEWEELRKEARKLESEVDVKLASFSKLGQGIGECYGDMLEQDGEQVCSPVPARLHTPSQPSSVASLLPPYSSRAGNIIPPRNPRWGAVSTPPGHPDARMQRPTAASPRVRHASCCGEQRGDRAFTAPARLRPQSGCMAVRAQTNVCPTSQGSTWLTAAAGLRPA